MGYIKTESEIALVNHQKLFFYDAEMLTAYFETKPEVVERLLPPPLKPAKDPFGAAFVARYPRTNFGVAYLESALFLLAEYDGQEGGYCLAMPVTSDMALILGREIFGYPKKIADIFMIREGQRVEGWTERHGTRFFEIKARLTGKFNDDAAQQIMAERMASPSSLDQVTYNFKYFSSPSLDSFDYNPRLVREVVELRPKAMEIGEAELTFRSSEHDFWGDVEIVRVLGAVYTVGDNAMLPGRVVAEADPHTFAPFASMKLDKLQP